MNGLWRMLWAGLAAAGPVLAFAAPFTPASDEHIVQRLPYRVEASVRHQRVLVSRQPTQLPLALAAARAAIARARQYGDPRELGQAMAVLAPWWDLADPPPQVRLLRATVRQSQHQFEAALMDLQVLIDAGMPLGVQAQAGLTRAALLQLGGRLSEARQACETLSGPRFASLGQGLALKAQACVAELRSLQGQPQRAANELQALARRAPDDPWLALLRAELAQRRGDIAGAQAHFRQALAGHDDVYTRAAYADWLLERGRAAEVLQQLDDASLDADALLLRRAIALQRLGRPQARDAAADLHARFDAARQRGERFHLREEALLALDVDGQADAALALAQANWQQQREPADVLLLARAAHAAGRPEAVAPVLQELQRSGWSDVRLKSLLVAR